MLHQFMQNTHIDNILLDLVCIMFLSSCTLFLCKINQPALLGQILIGFIIAIFAHYKIPFWTQMIHQPTIKFLGLLGSIFLLLEIGLESSFQELKKHTGQTFGVVLFGAGIPLILGYYIIAPVIFNNPTIVSRLFIGSILAVTSTSISITIFKQLKLLHQRYAQIVLSASIIDDIIGLILLAIIIELATLGYIDIRHIMWHLILVIAFFSLSFILINWVFRWWYNYILIHFQHISFILSLNVISLACLLAWWSQIIGLSPIIGAFIAGIYLHKTLEHTTQNYQQHIKHIGKLLIPIFFIYTSMQIDIVTTLNLHTLLLTLILCFFAILTKIFCGILVNGQAKWLIGLGMIPRGEIGIIFILTGLQYHIINNEQATALMLMIILTSIITSSGLNYCIRYMLQNKISN